MINEDRGWRLERIDTTHRLVTHATAPSPYLIATVTFPNESQFSWIRAASTTSTYTLVLRTTRVVWDIRIARK